MFDGCLQLEKKEKKIEVELYVSHTLHMMLMMLKKLITYCCLPKLRLHCSLKFCTCLKRNNYVIKHKLIVHTQDSTPGRFDSSETNAMSGSYCD